MNSRIYLEGGVKFSPLLSFASSAVNTSSAAHGSRQRHFEKVITDKTSKSDLKEILESFELRTNGDKPILMGRLQLFYLGWDNGDETALSRYFKMDKAALAVECATLKVSADGTNAEMRRRLVLAGMQGMPTMDTG
jgi:hypothetical protein